MKAHPLTRPPPPVPTQVLSLLPTAAAAPAGLNHSGVPLDCAPAASCRKTNHTFRDTRRRAWQHKRGWGGGGGVSGDFTVHSRGETLTGSQQVKKAV